MHRIPVNPNGRTPQRACRSGAGGQSRGDRPRDAKNTGSVFRSRCLQLACWGDLITNIVAATVRECIVDPAANIAGCSGLATLYASYFDLSSTTLNAVTRPRSMTGNLALM